MNRIRKLRKDAGMTQKELADRLFVNQTAVSQWERGATSPNQTTLLSLCNIFHCTTDYLLGLADFGRTFVFDSCANIPAQAIQIPVLGTVRAGLPIEAVQDVLDYEEVLPEMASKGNLFGLKVKGDSMAPDLREGDVVIVREQEDAENGDTVVAIINGDEATIKKIKKRPEGLMLIPINPAYEPMFFSCSDVASIPVRIIGKVIELRRTF